MGANQFVNFPTVTPGAKGAQAAVDLTSSVPSTGLDADLTFVLGTGDFSGEVQVQGSIDGTNWSTLCQFTSDTTSTDVTGTSATKVQSPYVVEGTIVRFVRLYVSAEVLSNLIVSVAGETNCDCATEGPGTNTFVVLPVIGPGASGPQFAIDLKVAAAPNGLDQAMTFVCTGPFTGTISIQGSIDASNWSTLCQFDSAGASKDGLLPPISIDGSAVRYLRTFTAAVLTQPVQISVAAEANCDCGTSCSGANSFLSFPVIPSYAIGSQASIDLVTLVPDSGLGEDLTFVCSGAFNGTIAVEGSVDGDVWSVLCQFDAGPLGTSSTALSPILVEGTIVRYLRAVVLGGVTTDVYLSVSGSQQCGCPSGCTPGTVVFDQTFTDVYAVASDGILGPTFGVASLPVGDLGCPNYRMTIEADCQWTGNIPLPPSGGASMHAYMADAGSDLATRAFIPGNVSDQLANLSTTIPLDGDYHHYVFSVYPTRTPSYVDFSGPLTNQNLFIWPPVLFPDFLTGFWNIKNIHVTITTM